MASSLLRVHPPRPPSALLHPPSSLLHKLSSSCLRFLPFPTPPSSSHRPPPLLRSCSRRLFSSLSPSPPPAPSPLHHPSSQEAVFEEPEQNELDAAAELGDEEAEGTGPVVLPPLPRLPSPKLSLKEKKELASYAHSLGKKLKSQQVGKSGVTPSVAAAFVETLEANELLKLKVHGSCPGELSDIINQLEQSTGSVAVGQIGRSVILYRPSLSKTQKKETQNTKNASNARSPTAMSISKVQKKRKVFAHQSR